MSTGTICFLVSGILLVIIGFVGLALFSLYRLLVAKEEFALENDPLVNQVSMEQSEYLADSRNNLGSIDRWIENFSYMIMTGIILIIISIISCFC